MKVLRPRPVADFLVSAVPDLRDWLLEARIRRSWPEAVGPEVARRARPIKLGHGCLEVAVDNSPWLQELTLRSPELTARLQQRFPDIRSLRLVLGAPDADAPEASIPDRRAATRPLSAEEAREIEESVGTIAEPELRASARRLLTRARQDANAIGGTR